MESLTVILKRFMQLLPFLTSPFGYRRFHFELFEHYPDIWNDRGTASIGFVAPRIHEEQLRSEEPAAPAANSSAAPNPAQRHARAYLTWLELHHSDRDRREPFW